MRYTTPWTVVAGLLMLANVSLAQNVTPTTCPSTITSIAGCPLIGCGGVADALLNQQRNRTDTPASPTDVTVADIKSLAQPTDWTTGQPRASISSTEGWQVRVIARLKTIRKEGKETCNCELAIR
jgi:hypothetical protein